MYEIFEKLCEEKGVTPFRLPLSAIAYLQRKSPENRINTLFFYSSLEIIFLFRKYISTIFCHRFCHRFCHGDGTKNLIFFAKTS